MDTLLLAANNGGGSNMMIIITFVLIIALTYFMMIKPQKKQQQKKAEMMNQLKKGDNVILIDGLHGKIDSVNTEDKTVVVDADGIYLTFSRMAVQQIIPATDKAATTETLEKPAIDTTEKQAVKTVEEANSDQNNDSTSEK